MKLWMRKLSVALIAMVTLGLYVPEFDIDVEAEQKKEAVDSDSDQHNEPRLDEVDDPHILTPVLPDATVEEVPEDDLNILSEKAKEQALIKMGPKIAARVEDDMLTEILPRMEEVIQDLMADTEQEERRYYSITERPADGFGEKIFNIYDERSGKDIARFHVRRDNRPREGYWFNFHYHTSSDGFENHHEIGEIYWDKNSPPKWMA